MIPFSTAVNARFVQAYQGHENAGRFIAENVLKEAK